VAVRIAVVGIPTCSRSTVASVAGRAAVSRLISVRVPVELLSQHFRFRFLNHPLSTARPTPLRSTFPRGGTDGLRACVNECLSPSGVFYMVLSAYVLFSATIFPELLLLSGTHVLRFFCESADAPPVSTLRWPVDGLIRIFLHASSYESCVQNHVLSACCFLVLSHVRVIFALFL
jgi:hypothetical protein